jgi:tRNA threonylcarbamoyladenosine modification (KEOPS) complex Cgi121 subunit
LKTATIKNSKWSVSIGSFKTYHQFDLQKLIAELTEQIKPCIFQFFDAQNIGGWEHIYMSAVNAVNAFDSGEQISNSLPLETLLYAACNDQISKALDIMGIKKDSRKLALIIFAESPEKAEEAFNRAVKIIGPTDDTVLDITPEKFDKLKKLFKISDLEFQAAGSQSVRSLLNLIIERGSLLRLKR